MWGGLSLVHLRSPIDVVFVERWRGGGFETLAVVSFNVGLFILIFVGGFSAGLLKTLDRVMRLLNRLVEGVELEFVTSVRNVKASFLFRSTAHK